MQTWFSAVSKLHKFAKSIVVQNEIRWDAEVNWSSKKSKLNSRSSESNSPRFYCFCAQLFISFSTLFLFHYRNLHARIAIQEIYTVTIKINGHVEPNFLILAKSYAAGRPCYALIVRMQLAGPATHSLSECSRQALVHISSA